MMLKFIEQVEIQHKYLLISIIPVVEDWYAQLQHHLLAQLILVQFLLTPEEIGPGPVANWGLDEGYGDSSTGNGPVAYWNLDENTNITATDLSGNGNTGTLTGSPTWVSGIYNSSVNFNGSSNYITINNSTSLNIRAPITLSAWIYPTSTASFQNVISKRNTTSPYSLRINNGTNLEYYFHDGTATREYIKTGVIKLNTWQFVAATNDGTNINLYVNGVNVLSTTTPYTPATTTDLSK